MTVTTATLASQPPRYREGEWELRCRTCGDWWPLTLEFYNPRHGTARCKACWREYQRLYEQGRRADQTVAIGIRAAQRAKYHANRDVRRASSRRWKAANRARIAAYQREWRERRKAETYSPGVSPSDLAGQQQALDNGGVSQPHIEDPTVSLADCRVVAA